jgi:hypothetical protein
VANLEGHGASSFHMDAWVVVSVYLHLCHCQTIIVSTQHMSMPQNLSLYSNSYYVHQVKVKGKGKFTRAQLY